MNHFHKGIFDKIQEKADITPDEIFKVADSVKHADFNDERTIRNLIRQLSKLANKPISKEKEDKIVEAVIKKNIPLNPQNMDQFFDD